MFDFPCLRGFWRRPQNHSLLMELLTDEGVGTMLIGSSRVAAGSNGVPTRAPVPV